MICQLLSLEDKTDDPLSLIKCELPNAAAANIKSERKAGRIGLARFTMNFILADSDCIYTQVLAKRLQSWNQAAHIEQCHQAESLHRLISERKEDQAPTCFLFNAAEFHALTHLPASSVWPSSWLAIPILPGRSEPDREKSPPKSQNEKGNGAESICYHRFDPVSSLIHQLNELFTEEEDTSDGFQGDQKIERLWLFVSLAEKAHRGHLPELIKQGRQVIYLPLMPTYQMHLISERTEGQTLSDLLLALLSDSVQYDELGRYWQTHPEGFLFFRPPERADDLVSCDPDILRRLVLLLRQKLNADPTQQMIAFIHCSGLPLASIASVAVLCDVCEMAVYEGHSFTAQSAQVEAGRLLALLPPSCRVIRHILPEPGKDGLRTPLSS